MARFTRGSSSRARARAAPATKVRTMPAPPPGVSPADFAAALRKFEAAVGEQWVFKSDEDVALCDASVRALADVEG